MTTPLRTFTGFKGAVAFAQIGNVSFALLAKNPRQLRILWASIMTSAPPLDPAGIKKAVLIEASLLPDGVKTALDPVRPSRPLRTTPTGLHHSAQGCEARATLGSPSVDSPNPERVASSCTHDSITTADGPCVVCRLCGETLIP